MHSLTRASAILIVGLVLSSASSGSAQPPPTSDPQMRYLEEALRWQKEHPGVQPPTVAPRFQSYTYGQGTLSCGQWLQAGNTDRFIYIAWVLGFVTRANSSEALQATDRAAMEQWVNNYCAGNPLDNISGAAERLVAALRK